MKAVILDNNYIYSDSLIRILENYAEAITIDAVFKDSAELLSYIHSKLIDIVFIDADIPQSIGFIAAQAIREFSHDIAIIFCSSTAQYAVDAFKLYAQGYILKPYTQDDVFTALNNAKHMLLHKKEIYATTFGNFDIFANGNVVHFSRNKSKELLALLIDRCGGEVTLDDIVNNILNNNPCSCNLRQLARKIVSSLKKDLEYYGLGDICSFKYGAYSINPKLLNCDYFKMLNGDLHTINSFTNEYMKQYEWAQPTRQKLIALHSSKNKEKH